MDDGIEAPESDIGHRKKSHGAGIPQEVTGTAGEILKDKSKHKDVGGGTHENENGDGGKSSGGFSIVIADGLGKR